MASATSTRRNPNRNGLPVSGEIQEDFNETVP